MVETVHDRNVAYQTAYHVVWRSKYRHDVIAGDVAEALSEMVHTFCPDKRWPVIALEVQSDHLHLFVSLPPSVAVANAVRS